MAKATTLGKSEDYTNMPARQRVLDTAVRLGVGQFSSQLCPACDGGQSREKTLSLDIGHNGIIKFHCFRASCDFSGTMYQSGLSVHRQENLDKEPGSRPYTGDLHPLSATELDFFGTRYGIDRDVSKNGIYRTEKRYALPLLSPLGKIRGYITRRPYDGSPADTPENRTDGQYQYKALTYMEGDYPVQSWYGDTDNMVMAPKVVIVEDCLSAMRIASYSRRTNSPQTAAVSICGTGVNARKIAEIQQVAYGSDVYIALDADATGQAFAMARKWGPAFNKCHVIVLSRDVKDMADDELHQLPLYA